MGIILECASELTRMREAGRVVSAVLDAGRREYFAEVRGRTYLSGE